MKKLLRFAGVALLALTIGVFGCGDDDPVAPVAPTVTVTVPPTTPTPPPPVVVKMDPPSQTIGVGGTVVFAVSVSGGVASEAATWTCASSDESKATVIVTPEGCAATAVAAGGVTIIAAVTKGGGTVNTAAALTITEDTAAAASVFIGSIKNSNKDDEDDEALSGRVNVTLSVVLGDQMITHLSVLVDDVVAEIRSFERASLVAASQDEPAQQAVHPFVLSFNSAHYDTLTGVPTYMNGERTISAQLMVASSDEPIESGFHDREFGNSDGVYVTVSGYTKLPVVGADGGYWYGGPDAGFDLRAVPVVYSERPVPSVTLRKGFCGENKAIPLTEGPYYDFTPDCKGFEGPVEAQSFSIGAAQVETLNADAEFFSIKLDYKAPGAPWFKPDPNGRQQGWINDAVGLTAKHVTSGPKKNLNGWLMAGDGAGGVGGNTLQIRYAAVPMGSSDKGLEAALAATPDVDPMVPAASKIDGYCFVASATDLLGNESKRPDPDAAGDIDTCPTAAEFMEFMEAMDAVDGEGAMEAVEEQAAVVFSAILAGVDKTAPTVIFTGASPKENDKELAKDFVLHVSDDEDGSGLVEDLDPADDVMVSAVRARYEIRKDNEKGMVCVDDAALPGVEKAGECKSDAVGLTRDGPLFTATGTSAETDTDAGYYTLTASASDKAGNKSSPEVSRTALHDNAVPVASLILTKEDADTYNKILVAADGLSIQDYTVTVDASNLPSDTVVRLATVTVDEYNARPLSTAKTVSGPVELPFSAVQGINNGRPEPFAVGDGVNVITAHVTDQADNADMDPSGDGIVNTSIGALDDDDLNRDEDGFDPADFATDGFVFTAEVDDVAVTINTGDNNVGKSDGTVTLKATADLNNQTTANPFDAVHFYAGVGDINTGKVTDDDNDRAELRLIKTVMGVNGILKTGTERVWTYEVDASADDIYALVGARGAGDYMLYAIGVNGSGVALVSAGVDAGFAKR